MPWEMLSNGLRGSGTCRSSELCCCCCCFELTCLSAEDPDEREYPLELLRQYSPHLTERDLACLVHAVKHASVGFTYARAYRIYANTRPCAPRQRQRHQTSQLVSLPVPFLLNNSGNQSGSLEMARLQRREHVSK